MDQEKLIRRLRELQISPAHHWDSHYQQGVTDSLRIVLEELEPLPPCPDCGCE